MYSVRWTRTARNGLATAWVEAKDRKSVNDAVVQIDAMLTKDPDHAGESRDQGRRLLLQEPIGIFFKVDHTARIARVTRAWSFRGSKSHP